MPSLRLENFLIYNENKKNKAETLSHAFKWLFEKKTDLKKKIGWHSLPDCFLAI